MSGVANVIKRVSGTESSVTSNTSSSVVVNAVSVSGISTNTSVLFESDGDFASANSDGSTEFFRHSINSSSTTQLTDFDIGIFSAGRALGGGALGDGGDALLYSTGPATSGGIACDDEDLNEAGLRFGAPAPSPTFNARPITVLPPFELESVVCDTDTFLPDVECVVRIVNPAEEARTFVMNAKWTLSAGSPLTQQDSVGAFEIDPNDEALVTLPFDGAGSTEAAGSISVHVLSVDVPMADTAAWVESF